MNRRRVSTFPLRFAFLLAIASLATVSANEQVGSPPVTITTHVKFGESGEAMLADTWLAGVAAQPDAAPSTVALCWARTAQGWFGDVWGLQLVTDAGLLPPALSPQRGSGFLAGMDYSTVGHVTPEQGHVYETVFSYYPSYGAVAGRVVDTTTATVVWSGSYQVRPYMARVHVATDMSRIDLVARPVFAPLHVRWGLVQPALAGLMSSKVIDRRSQTELRLTVPWSELPGSWTLRATDDRDKAATLVEAILHGQEALFPLATDMVQALPAGEVFLTLEYKDGDEVTYTNHSSVQVGRVEAALSELRVSCDSTVTGIISVATDGPVGSLAIKLNATQSNQFYDRDDRGVLKMVEQPATTNVVSTVEGLLAPAETLEIPFAVDLADVFPEGRSYADIRLEFEPEVSSTVIGVSTTTTAQTVSVTIGRPQFTIKTGEQHQTIDGFGASGAWWSQYVGGMSDPMRNLVADLLFSREKGIGLSQYRYNAGGGIDPDIRDPWRTAETFEVAEGVYDWSLDANARWFLQAAKERGVQDFTLFAVSPPRRITVSGHTYNKHKGDSNLAPEMYPQFAQYLADIWRHFHEEGITFSTISPLNEPEWRWEAANQEGTQYTLSQVLAISRELAKTLRREAIEAKLLIPEAGAWHFLYGGDRGYAQAILSDPILSEGTLLAVHSYWTTDAQRVLAAEALARYLGQKVWQTEWCEMLGGRDYGMGSALTLAHTVHADLTLGGVSAWQHWVAVDRYDHRDSLLYTEYFLPGDAENVEETKKLWALGNYSRFVRPGAVRLGVDSNYILPAQEYRSSVLLSAFADRTTDQLIVVCINQADSERSVELIVPGSDRGWVLAPYRTSDTESLQELSAVSLQTDESGAARGTIVLAPLSVTTFVGGYTEM